MTVRQALNEAMAEEMRRDKDVFIMGEEVAEYQGAYKITQGLLQEFGPQRVIDTPITEHGFAGIGVGAAFAGLRPIVEFMTWNFAMQAIDQIINSRRQAALYVGRAGACADRVPRAQRRGRARRRAAQPGLFGVVQPRPGPLRRRAVLAADAKGLLKAAIRSNNPVVFLENEILYGSTGLVPKVDDYVLPIGKARIARPGKDVTIVSFSMGMRYATQATEKLVAAGVDVELIDLRTLRPMDSATVIESVKKTGRHRDGGGGLAAGRHRRRTFGARRRRGLRLSRCAAHARHRQGRADALCRQPREAGAAQRRRGRRGGERRDLPELRP